MITEYSLSAHSDAAYPDYVPCPHCGEPEVEVWSYEKTARCHNCARTFESYPAMQSQAAEGDLNSKTQTSKCELWLH